MFDIKEYSVQKTEESSLFCGLTPNFHVIFHIIYFFTTNGDIKKNNWLQKFGKFSRKLHDFNNCYTSVHQYFKKPDKDAFAFTVAFQSIPKFSGISKKKLSLKFC